MKKKIIIKWNDDNEPEVTMLGDDWTAQSVIAAKRLVSKAYRNWQKLTRVKLDKAKAKEGDKNGRNNESK